jgi:hypothetical protein
MSEPETQPYEFLVRFRDGKISGAHVQFITIYPDGHFKLHDAQPISKDTKFPLSEILDQSQAAALATIAELLTANAELQDRVKTMAELQERVATLEEQIQILESNTP